MNQDKKSELGFSIVGLIIILAVLGFVSFVGWRIYGKPRAASPAPTNSLESKVVSMAAKAVSDKYDYIDVNTSGWAAQIGWGASIPASGYEYGVSTQNFPSAYFVGKEIAAVNPPASEVIKNVKEAIGQVMGTNGYKLADETYSIPDVYDNIYKTNHKPSYTVYKLNDSTCLDIFYSELSESAFSCFTKTDVADAFTKAKPYVDTYITANPSIAASAITFGPATVKSQNGAGVIGLSHEAGYDISEAIISINNVKKIALYYNHLGGPWAYITQANDEYGFICGSYTANTTVRKVMYNQICLGNKGQIRLDTANRALQ